MNEQSREQPSDDVVSALVDLALVIDQMNARVRREGEQRAGETLLEPAELVTILHVQSHPGRSVVEVSASTGEPLATVRTAVRTLERRGLIEIVESDGNTRAVRYRSTERALMIRDLVRGQCATQMRYAMASLAESHLRDIDRAVEAIRALNIALGFEEIHPSYRPEPPNSTDAPER